MAISISIKILTEDEQRKWPGKPIIVNSGEKFSITPDDGISNIEIIGIPSGNVFLVYGIHYEIA